MSICPRRCSVFFMMPPGLCSIGRTCMDLVSMRGLYCVLKTSGLQDLKHLPVM